jgi:hypothetical protein
MDDCFSGCLIQTHSKGHISSATACLFLKTHFTSMPKGTTETSSPNGTDMLGIELNASDSNNNIMSQDLRQTTNRPTQATSNKQPNKQTSLKNPPKQSNI